MFVVTVTFVVKPEHIEDFAPAMGSLRFGPFLLAPAMETLGLERFSSPRPWEP